MVVVVTRSRVKAVYILQRIGRAAYVAIMTWPSELVRYHTNQHKRRYSSYSNIIYSISNTWYNGINIPVPVLVPVIGIRLCRSRVDPLARATFLRYARIATFKKRLSKRNEPSAHQAGLRVRVGSVRVRVVAAVSRSRKHTHRLAKNPLQSRDKNLHTSLKQHHFMRAHLRKFACAGRSSPAVPTQTLYSHRVYEVQLQHY